MDTLLNVECTSEQFTPTIFCFFGSHFLCENFDSQFDRMDFGDRMDALTAVQGSIAHKCSSMGNSGSNLGTVEVSEA